MIKLFWNTHNQSKLSENNNDQDVKELFKEALAQVKEENEKVVMVLCKQHWT